MIPEGISDLERWSNYIQDEGFDKNLNLMISKNGKNLCSISGTSTYTIQPLEQDERLYHSFLISGLVEWFFNYSESTNSSTVVDSINLDGDVQKWFHDRVDEKILVIDTNVIIDRIFSSLDILGHDIISKTSVQIPRLAILELERKSNENTGLKKNKSKLGYGELMFLKTHGATPMGELSIELLTGFFSIAKDKKTDAWIRREIKETRQRYLKSRTAARFVLMTSDLINSFSAIAEDIDTISISRINNWKDKLRNPSLEQIGKIIITLSVLYENIRVEVNGKKFDVEGVWEGKTTHNWTSEQAHYKEKT